MNQSDKKKPKRLPYIRITPAAKQSGITYDVVYAAIRDGRMKSYETLCGYPLVKLEDVAALPKRARGRPAKRKKRKGKG